MSRRRWTLSLGLSSLLVGAVSAQWASHPGEPGAADLEHDPDQRSEVVPRARAQASAPGAPTAAEPPDAQRAPGGPGWLVPPAPPAEVSSLPQVPTAPGGDFPLFVRVRERAVSVSYSYDAPRYHVGELRLGAVVRARSPESPGPGCAGGWLELQPRGLLCGNDDIAFTEEGPPPISALLPPPHPRAVVPHRYVKVTDREGFRYDDPPDLATIERIREGDRETRDAYGARSLDGAYFLAIEEQTAVDGETWLKTHEGNFVRESITEPIGSSALVGSHIEDPDALPLAFVTAPKTPARDDDGEVVGYARRYARVSLDGKGEPDADGFVRTEDGLRLPAEHLRVVRRLSRPRSIPDDARWLQIDHARQTLLLYDGRRPVYASLVSSGKPGRETPRGVHRVEYKHLTVTMRGEDPDGPYEVQEVPWVLYYDGPYAVHGAYWHDGFGEVRSHGCTNLAPADARHVFRFMRPELPAGWHTSSEVGSYVHMTRGS